MKALAGWEIPLPPPSSSLSFHANDAIEKLVSDYSFSTVLDIGPGTGDHARYFEKHEKKVTTIGPDASNEYIPTFVSSFESFQLEEKYDLVWSSHVLEHVFDVHFFLKKIASAVKDEGIIAITVPPLKHNIVNEHINLFNQGILLYRMVCAGIDCSKASVKIYGYNISIIVKKENNLKPFFYPPPLHSIQKYFPFPIEHNQDGRMPLDHNW